MMIFNRSISHVRLTAIVAFAAIAGISAPALSQTAGSDPASPLEIQPPAGSVGGMGDINLFPKRVVIDGRRQIATIGLYNKTADAGDYEIDIVDMAMTTDGQLLNFTNGASEADKAKVKTASPFLRYSPRRVSLGGSESQVIRIMARGGAELPDGEYRSHFVATSIPRDTNEGFSIDDAVTGSGPDGIGVTIRPRFGISIPVIVRIGETTLNVGITGAELLTALDGSQAIGLTLTRSGTRSAFGDVVITAKGASEPVAISRGIGIYPEVDSRSVIIPIDPATDKRFLAPGTTLSISFTDDDFEPGATLAEHTLTLP